MAQPRLAYGSLCCSHSRNIFCAKARRPPFMPRTRLPRRVDLIFGISLVFKEQLHYKYSRSQGQLKWHFTSSRLCRCIVTSFLLHLKTDRSFCLSCSLYGLFWSAICLDSTRRSTICVIVPWCNHGSLGWCNSFIVLTFPFIHISIGCQTHAEIVLRFCTGEKN